MKSFFKWSRAVFVLVAVCGLQLAMPVIWAQTLGTAPQFDVAVQGQTGAQPEGAFFNFINWIGNVVAPVGAGGSVFGAIIAYLSGRQVGRWLLASAALLAVSGPLVRCCRSSAACKRGKVRLAVTRSSPEFSEPVQPCTDAHEVQERRKRRV